MGVCARVVRHGDYASHRSATEHTQLVSFCDDGSRLRDGSDYLAKEELFWRMNDIVLGIWGQDFRFDVLTRVQSAQSSNNTIVANHVWSLDSNASTHGYTGTVSNCVTPSTDNATNYLSKNQSLSPCLANTMWENSRFSDNHYFFNATNSSVSAEHQLRFRWATTATSPSSITLSQWMQAGNGVDGSVTPLDKAAVSNIITMNGVTSTVNCFLFRCAYKLLSRRYSIPEYYQINL